MINLKNLLAFKCHLNDQSSFSHQNMFYYLNQIFLTKNQCSISDNLKFKYIRPDATFNWKTFYFSILILTLIYFIQTSNCLHENKYNVLHLIDNLDFLTNDKQINQLNLTNQDYFLKFFFRPSSVHQPFSHDIVSNSYLKKYINNSSNNAFSSNFYLYKNIFDNYQSNLDFLNKNVFFKQIPKNEKSNLLNVMIDNEILKLNTLLNNSILYQNIKTSKNNLYSNLSLYDKQNNKLNSNKSLLDLDFLTNSKDTYELENETKIKRRFAEEKDLFEKQLEDSSKYNLQKTQAMKQMQHFEQQFHTLKQRLNSEPNYNGLNSNRLFPKSSTSKLNASSITISSRSIDYFNSVGNLIENIEIIRDEDKNKYFTMNKFCSICYCNDKKKDTLKCIRNNQLSFIPILPKAERHIIFEIILLNQAHFTELNREQLQYYPNITKITIQFSGLRYIATNAFKSTLNLREIDLKHNQIKQLSWKLFDELSLLELTINDNPLPCNCSSKWIQLLMQSKNSETLGPLWDNITCIDNFANKIKPLLNVTIKGCELPSVTINPSIIQVKERDHFFLNCETTGSPLPNVFWNTTGLKSNFSELLIKSNNHLNMSSINNTLSSVKKIVKPIIKKLEVFSANRADNVQIMCYAENIVGKGKAYTSIRVNSRPRIEYLEMRKKFYWCISYRITGMPLANKTWFYNGEFLEFNENIQDYGLSSNFGFKIDGCLQIKGESHIYNGIYTLVVENEFGKENKSIDAIFHNDILQRSPQIDQPATTVNLNNNFSNLNKENYFNFIIVSSFILICLIFFVAFIFILGCNSQSKTQNRFDLQEKGLAVQEKLPIKLSRFVDNPNYLEEKKQLLSNLGIRHIESKRIELIKEIGEGAFGRVYLGTVQDLINFEDDENFHEDNYKNNKTKVAVKVLKDMPEQLNSEFERESELLSNLSHENIVTFYGISVDQHPFMMIFEYMKNGDLNSFLRSCYTNSTKIHKNKSKKLNLYSSNVFQTIDKLNEEYVHYVDNDLNENKIYKNNKDDQSDEDSKESDKLLLNKNEIKFDKEDGKHQENKFLEKIEIKCLKLQDLLKISIQICNGMKYLAEQHFVHRDLATRNCLVSDGLVVKIGDFGMSRDVYSTDYYKIGRQTALPMRWMPPESIMYRKFTIESDVWSFGVCLWEIFTFGKQPFFELSNIEVIQEVINGKYLAKPEKCPDEIYELMLKCWKYQSQNRISMAQLYQEFSKLDKEHLENKV